MIDRIIIITTSGDFDARPHRRGGFFTGVLYWRFDIDIVKTCQSQFSFDLRSIVIEKRVKKFNKSLNKSIPS